MEKEYDNKRSVRKIWYFTGYLRYYERVNVIPKVTRTSGGIWDYQEEDLRWVELAVSMRNAGLPIESLIEYQRLLRYHGMKKQ